MSNYWFTYLARIEHEQCSEIAPRNNKLMQVQTKTRQLYAQKGNELHILNR